MSPQVRKRRVFFSFHYQDDVRRVNRIRNSWRYNHESTRESEGFFDAGIWETSRRTGPDSLKNLIREGIKNTSVTCVLAGARTYGRRWVRYELARSVIKGNGLLAVKIHLMFDQDRKGSNEYPDFSLLAQAGKVIKVGMSDDRLGRLAA
ncbi:MAG: TIR domain-containing protein [Hyphomonadaceae bacterium]|nr:TIR domain-containing protein [Hyphomonadaceae bacterium]MBC6411780.1 TIR domain-containing protein [Hyphomonadaceae bacterium]